MRLPVGARSRGGAAGTYDVAMDEVAAFYDGLAEDYTAIFRDWDAAVARQGERIDSLIRGHADGAGRSIIDPTCGIGTQAIGLALRGYQVTATDISPASIARARVEAERLGAPVSFAVADLRTLDDVVAGPFDVAISFDNALPHLLTDDELAAALSILHGVLRPGGLLLASIRDYDALLEDRPTGEPARISGPEGARRLAAQAWQWAEDGRSYRLHQFIGREDPDGAWTLRHLETTYRALRRAELASLAQAAGFVDLAWLEPSGSTFYQPVLVAYRP